jgi:hypothetical protein
MTGFRDPNFIERRNAAESAKKAALEKFRANAADPAFAERQKARTESAADRVKAKSIRDTEKAEAKARDAKLAAEAKHEAAVLAERTLTEKANRELALEIERKAARDARYAARKAIPRGAR